MPTWHAGVEGRMLESQEQAPASHRPKSGLRWAQPWESYGHRVRVLAFRAAPAPSRVPWNQKNDP
jgi:hypothetical protein